MNKNCITEKIHLVFTYLRLKRLQQRVRGFNFEHWANISSKTDIEISKDSIVSLGKGIHTRPYSSIAVREKAELTIGRNVFVNRNTIIACRKNISIGNNVTIGPNCCIYDHDHDITRSGEYVCKEVVIARNVWIGGNVMILKGVTIGENSVVAAGSIVVSDVPSNTILYQKRQNSYKPIFSNENQ